MRKKEFLEELKENLIGISEEDVKEIIEDYEEHFKIGKRKKRTESKISKSLGDPRQIAKEARRELNENNTPLKIQAIETWIEIKKFVKGLWNNFKDTMDRFSVQFEEEERGMTNNINSKNKNRVSISKEKSSKIKLNRTLLVLSFNFLIFIWIWISLFFVFISFILSGFAIVFSGIAMISGSIFMLINYSTPILRNILFSTLFAGIGIIILGILLIEGSFRLTKRFLKLTKRYIELNKKYTKE